MNQSELVSKTIYTAVNGKLPQVMAPQASQSSLIRTLQARKLVHLI